MTEPMKTHWQVAERLQRAIEDATRAGGDELAVIAAAEQACEQARAAGLLPGGRHHE